jgi:hypothetical protein
MHSAHAVLQGETRLMKLGSPRKQNAFKIGNRVAFAWFLALIFFSNALCVHAQTLNGADFYLHNNTSRKMIGVFIVPSYIDESKLSTSEWKNYAIVDNDGNLTTLWPDHSVKVNMHGDSCVYDIVGIFEDHTNAHKFNVNLCGISDFNFTQ